MYYLFLSNWKHEMRKYKYTITLCYFGGFRWKNVVFAYMNSLLSLHAQRIVGIGNLLCLLLCPRLHWYTLYFFGGETWFVLMNMVRKLYRKRYIWQEMVQTKGDGRLGKIEEGEGRSNWKGEERINKINKIEIRDFRSKEVSVLQKPDSYNSVINSIKILANKNAKCRLQDLNGSYLPSVLILSHFISMD